MLFIFDTDFKFVSWHLEFGVATIVMIRNGFYPRELVLYYLVYLKIADVYK